MRNPDFKKAANSKRFRERHLVENLRVEPYDAKSPVMFFNMLNQGNKRGKETQVLALDCERVLTKNGERLARVSIVNYYGNVVFDTLVQPIGEGEENFIADYREWITGIKPKDLEKAPLFATIEPIIKKIVKGKTIVGHSLKDDLESLEVSSDSLNLSLRDIAKIELFMKRIDKSSVTASVEKPFGLDPSSEDSIFILKRKLRDLAEEFLNAAI